MNIAARLLMFASAAYLGIQVARWTPALAFPLGVIAACTVGLWILRSHQAAVDAYRDLDERATEAAGRVVTRELLDERQEVRR